MNNQHKSWRSTAPVFIVGSPRSGTTLLYDMLLSAGGFAVYLGESSVFNVLAPRFGDLANEKNRRRMIEAWLGSKLFRVTRLDAGEIKRKLLSDGRNPGIFLLTFMEEVAAKQGATRWAANTPEEILYLLTIKKTIPNALVIHIIRDGRDVAASLSKKRYIQPFPWKERETLSGAGIYWEWIVNRGRKYGDRLGEDYLEIRFEDLVRDPIMVLEEVGRFIEHELNYARVQECALGSVKKPNTSFRHETQSEFNPVGRWKRQFTQEQLEKFESLIGRTLHDLGYPLSTNARRGISYVFKKALYRSFFQAKLWYKNNALFRAFRSELSPAEIDQIVIADEKGAAEYATRLSSKSV